MKYILFIAIMTLVITAFYFIARADFEMGFDDDEEEYGEKRM